MDTSNKTSDLLSEEEILQAPESEYMSDEQLAFFRQKLIDLYESTCVSIKEAKDKILTPIDLSDANDRASSEEQSNIALRIVDREQKLLPKIQQSLKQIQDGSYGYCLESGEPIGIPRLLARPTAEYSADVKSLKEMKELRFKD